MTDMSAWPLVEIEIRGRSYGARRVRHVPRVGDVVVVDLERGTVTKVISTFHGWRESPAPHEHIRVVAP